MRHLKNLILAPLIVLIAVPSLAQTSDSPAPDGRFTLEFEAGPVWQTVNDIQIPNTDQGTRFSLVDLVGKGPDSAWRGYLTWRISQKSDLRLLYAPLSLTETGTPEGDILFNGSTFAGGEEISATYKFNSYRLTYSYLLHDGPSWMWRLGFTAKIRDAKVQLVQGSLDSTKDDLGFVPLLHLSSRYDFARNWYLSFDVDALAGGPGRAVDLALKLGRRLGDGVHAELGYRTVEGGADVEEVYSFAWLHYAVAGVRIEMGQ
jgi:hypothetical protein